MCNIHVHALVCTCILYYYFGCRLVGVAIFGPIPCCDTTHNIQILHGANLLSYFGSYTRSQYIMVMCHYLVVP